MRVAFLTWRDSTHPDGGGSEVFVEAVARELAHRGHEVTIRCAVHPDSPAAEDVDGVRLERKGGRLGVYPRALLWTARNRQTVDVVVDVINGLPFGTPLVRRTGVVALVHHVHERQWHIIYPRFWGHVGWFVESRLVPRLYRRTPHLTVSEASKRDLVSLGVPAEQITVARNGLAASRSDAPKSPTPRLCVLARLVPHKQIEHALRLVADLRDEHPGLVLDVIGEGWWHEQLVAESERLDVQGSVVFHGHLPARDRDDVLAAAWVMVLPSVKEGWGLAVLEAAAQGTPTVAYRAAGGVCESIVDGETGRVVDGYDELVVVVRRLLGDADVRATMGRRAQSRSTEFTWRSTTDVVEALLRAQCDQRLP